MKNLEQIRAKTALAADTQVMRGKNDGDVVKKIPALILNHGLLAVNAYALGEKNEGYQHLFAALARHLADPGIKLLPDAKPDNMARHLLDYLSKEADSSALRQVTAEAMAWLNYARRFIKNKE